MSTKKKVYGLLKNNMGSFISGQEMAEKIYVTRASVWKAIKALERDGYEIEAVTNKGYRLKHVIDSVDADVVAAKLIQNGLSFYVKYCEEVDSTNDEARRLAQEMDDNIIVIAGAQTRGRGRRGREFYSPGGSGLYMSILVHTKEDDFNIATITGKAAVAVAKAIDKVVYNDENKTLIKWVNDIYLADHKVCGILSERYSSLEDGSNDYIIIGIGINVYEPREGFPKEIKNTAGFLISKENTVSVSGGREGLLNSLAIAIVGNVFYYLNNEKESIEIYRAKSNLINNYVMINSFKPEQPHSKRYAQVLGIADNYHLLIKYESGETDELSSGEVSVVKY